MTTEPAYIINWGKSDPDYGEKWGRIAREGLRTCNLGFDPISDPDYKEKLRRHLYAQGIPRKTPKHTGPQIRYPEDRLSHWARLTARTAAILLALTLIGVWGWPKVFPLSTPPPAWLPVSLYKSYSSEIFTAEDLDSVFISSYQLQRWR